MFHSRGMEHRINRIHEKALQLIYTGISQLHFNELLKKGKTYKDFIVLLILKYKSITKMKLDLILFIQEIIYLKQRMEDINKSWWVQINRSWLDSMYVNGDNEIYFDSSGVDYISKETKKIIRQKKYQQIFIEYKHMIE